MEIENQDAFAVHSEEAVSGGFTIAAKNAGKEDIMQNVYEKLISCYESIREKIPFTPRVALVLGSGLGDYAEEIRVEAELDYHEIDGFPVSTVPGHAGKFIFGWIGSVPVVCMKGRVHFYEGYPVSDVVLPIRLMKRMGAELLFLTNASGGIMRATNSCHSRMILQTRSRA